MNQLDIDLDQMGTPNAGSNALGIAGFITSVLGLLTGGCLSPIGLLISFVALFRAPRGFAIAGTIIGFIGSLGFIILGLVLGAALLLFTAVGVAGIATVASAGGIDGLNTVARFKDVAGAVVEHREETGSFPASLDQLSGSGLSSDRITDPWGTPIEYTLVSEGAGFALTSAGPDGAFATGDDYSITFDGNTVRVILNGQEHDLDGLADILNAR